MDLESLIEECLEWSIDTFGGDRVALRKLHHLNQEVDEVIKEVEASARLFTIADKTCQDANILEEYADCMILLTTSFKSLGFSLADVQEAMSRKLDKNRSRNWGKPDANGVVNHI